MLNKIAADVPSRKIADRFLLLVRFMLDSYVKKRCPPWLNLRYWQA
jgi:hypothetical protein